MKKSKKLFLSSILLISLVFFLSTTNTSNYEIISAEVIKDQTDSHIIHALVDHGPIVIDYDENFTDYGFPGDGSAGNPYRIEDLNITAVNDHAIFFGGDTTKHFVIQNCFIKSVDQDGINLGQYSDMANGTVSILNNEIIAADNYGIDIDGGMNSLISGNNITCYYIGIYLKRGNYSIISNNIIVSADDHAVSLTNSANCTITRNVLIPGKADGVQNGYSPDTIISYNNISAYFQGVRILESDNLKITNNIFKNGNMAISSREGDNAIITNNRFENNDDYAIVFHDTLTSSDNNIIHHNAFINNSYNYGAGISQALDDGVGNIWFDTAINEGNYWDDWSGTDSYYINGTAGAEDLYPLGSIPEISEYSSYNNIYILLAGLLSTPIALIKRKRRK